ncbi:MAG: 23S rRNA (uracil(1939)-C(5))-methyltransferase RlmD [Lachnospiraceae bacterium]|nr:23S rRNA (uracil(1939)-C(5))-methyltransferase RlmD [Lachnospiraceae bacterium]
MGSLKKGQEYTCKILKTTYPDKGIAECEGEKIVVKGVLEGQTVNLRVTKVRNGRYEGKVLSVIEKSPLEVNEPFCPHFESCGGCAYQRLNYNDLLNLKAGQVKDIIDSCVDYEYEFLGIAPSPNDKGYRNKMEFSFGDSEKNGELTLGLHKLGSFYDILQITDCKITNEDYNSIVKFTIGLCRKWGLSYCHKMSHKGYLRHLLIRRAATTGEILVSLITTSQWLICADSEDKQFESDFLNEFKEGLLSLDLNGSIVGILHMINDDPADAVKADKTEVIHGKDFFFEEILSQIFKITTFSFFQTNSFGAEVLYGIVRDFVGDMKDKSIFDLYSGTGTIAQVLAPVAKKITGVEIVAEAVESAKMNAALNNLSNCDFICGDVLKILDELTDKPDIIVLDPPREGIHPKALDKIIKFGVNRIVYVSCKPTSLSKDLEVLNENGYRVKKVKCCDMFPWTRHVETVCLLEKCES